MNLYRTSACSTKKVLLTLAAASLMRSIACIEDVRPISTRSRQPLKAEFGFRDSLIVENRFLLIPIQPESKWDDSAKISIGSIGVSGSAWSGLFFGKGYSGEQLVNMQVVDLKSHSTRTVFNRQVALGEWRRSMQPD